jgi:hypothetical protein
MILVHIRPKIKEKRRKDDSAHIQPLPTVHMDIIFSQLCTFEIQITRLLELPVPPWWEPAGQGSSSRVGLGNKLQFKKKGTCTTDNIYMMTCHAL